jgi:hypothetical protein
VGAPSGAALIQKWNGTTWKDSVAIKSSKAVLQNSPSIHSYAGHGTNRSSQSGDVTVVGPVSCAGLYPPPPLDYKDYFAARVRFTTSTGFAADATLLLGGLAYSVNLSGVPPGGETAFAYVTCASDSFGNPCIWGPTGLLATMTLPAARRLEMRLVAGRPADQQLWPQHRRSFAHT